MTAQNAPVIIVKEKSVQELLLGLSPIKRQVIYCESGGKQFKDNGEVLRGQAGEYGIGQFMPSTWEWFNEIRYKKDSSQYLDILVARDQIDMLSWAFDNGYESHWTCYRIVTMRS